MKLRIFLPAAEQPEAAMPLRWMLRDARGGLLREGESPLAEIPRAADVEAVLPSQRVLFARLKLPRVSDKIDYAPGSTVNLTGTNWDTATTSSKVHIRVDDNVGNAWIDNIDVAPASNGSITTGTWCGGHGAASSSTTTA